MLTLIFSIKVIPIQHKTLRNQVVVLPHLGLGMQTVVHRNGVNVFEYFNLKRHTSGPSLAIPGSNMAPLDGVALVEASIQLDVAVAADMVFTFVVSLL